MSKPVKQITNCEHCGRVIDLASPPLREYYKDGRIDIGKHSSVLLDRPENATSHAASLEGFYCDIECLVAHVKELRSQRRPRA